MRVRIIDTPPGEAPEHIRQAWIGCLIPLIPGHSGPVRMSAYGVLTGPRTRLGHWWRKLTFRVPPSESLYLVYVADALADLEKFNPEAATWWRENTPHLMVEGSYFGFDECVCDWVG